MWTAWFKISPDSIYMIKETTGSMDAETGLVTSITTYSNHLTRVLDGSPVVSKEIVAPSSPSAATISEDDSSGHHSEDDTCASLSSHSLDPLDGPFMGDHLEDGLADFFSECFDDLDRDPCLLTYQKAVSIQPPMRTVTPPPLIGVAVSTAAESRSAFPLKKVTQKCVYSGRLSLQVRDELITHMDYTFW
jgi:hypothetical protein